MKSVNANKLDYSKMEASELLLHLAMDLIKELKEKPDELFSFGGDIDPVKNSELVKEVEALTPHGKEVLGYWFGGVKSHLNFLHKEKLKNLQKKKVKEILIEEIQKTGVGVVKGTFRSEQPILGMLGGIEMHNKLGMFQIKLSSNNLYLGEYTLRNVTYVHQDDNKFEGFISFGKSKEEKVESSDADIYVVGWYEDANPHISCESVGYFTAVQSRRNKSYKW